MSNFFTLCALMIIDKFMFSFKYRIGKVEKMGHWDSGTLSKCGRRWFGWFPDQSRSCHDGAATLYDYWSGKVMGPNVHNSSSPQSGCCYTDSHSFLSFLCGIKQNIVVFWQELLSSEYGDCVQLNFWI